MKIAGLTIVKDDPLTEKWLRYYRPFFDHTVVIDQSGSAKNLCDRYGAQHLYFNNDGVGDGRWRSNRYFVNERRKELIADYDVVFHADADEFVVADPDTFLDLRHYLECVSRPITYSNGYEIAGHPRVEIDWSKPVLHQLSRWCPNHLYGKPHVATVYDPLTDGLHGCDNHIRKPEWIDKQLATIHMAFADFATTVHRYSVSYPNVTREEIENHYKYRLKHSTWIPGKYKRSGI